ncbi:MAG: PP2C family protein-serine/threonine phosphatase [Planctomycetota bacterium]
MSRSIVDSPAVRPLLEMLPAALGGECSIEVRSPQGSVLYSASDRLAADPVELDVTFGERGERLRVLVAARRLPEARVLVRALAGAAEERVRIEREMESVFAGSLQLLEEVAMTADMLSKLPRCASDDEVVRLGLEALLLGASIGRVVWVETSGRSGLAFVRRELEMSPLGEVETRSQSSGADGFDPRSTIIERACAAGTEGLIERGHESGVSAELDLSGDAEVLAVPARFGDAESENALGVLIAIDKRASSYAEASRLGSHEAKTAGMVALMIAAAIGNRRAALAGQELALARAIQQQVLPATGPQLRGYSIRGRCATSGAVGGDYFDFIQMADGRTLAFVGDVSGHDLASGMVMVGARSALRVIAPLSNSPALILERLADSIHDDLFRTERFVTAAGVAVDPHSGRIEFVGAGHPDGFVVRARNGGVERLESSGPMLGFMPGSKFLSVESDLAAGDLVLLYTDGVIEAPNAAGEEFGEDRLLELLKTSAGLDAETILDRVFAAVASHCGEQVRGGDDVTVVALTREGVTGNE